MPSRSVMGQVVGSDQRTVQGQERGLATDLAGPRKGPVRASATEDANAHDVEAAKLIYDAVGIFGAESWGAELSAMTKGEVDSGLVAKMRGGKKSTPLRALLPLLRDPDAALALLTAMSRYAGLAPPTKPRKVTADECDRVLARKVRVTAEVFAIYRSHVAAALGTTEEDVDAAYAEPVAK
jgi:hypothetical protein